VDLGVGVGVGVGGAATASRFAWAGVLWGVLGVAGTLGLASGCGVDARRVSVRVVRGPGADGCGPPAVAPQVELFAQGDFVEIGASGPADQPLLLDALPAATRELRVTLLGPGGAVAVLGRSGTFELESFADGDEIPILFGPPRGLCQVGGLLQARRRPAATRVGRAVLVVGGEDALGGPVGTAELYDPSRAAFELVPDAPFDDLRGARALTLADGRALILWEDGLQLYDPDARQFSPAFRPQGADVLGHAQAVVLGDGRVLIAGGCVASGATPPCLAGAQAAIFDPATLDFAAAPSLAVARAGGEAFVDGDGRVILVGGSGADGQPVTTIERWQRQNGGVALAAATTGAAAPLPAGGVLIAGAPPGAPPQSGAMLVAPLGGPVSVVPSPTARAGATMTALDDGAVLVFGGLAPSAPSSSDEAELYLPSAARFEAISGPGASAPSVLGRRRDHAAVALADGAVLIFGGQGASGEVLGDAFVYRHDATGPWSSLPTQIAGAQAGLLVADDPASTTVLPGSPPRLALTGHTLAVGPLAGWITLAGPRYADVEVKVGAAVSGGAGAGLALLVGMTSAGDYVLVELRAGEPVRVRRVQAGVPGPLACETGAALPGLTAEAGPHQIELSRRGVSVRVKIDGGPAATCTDVPTDRGLVGVGLLGAAGDVLELVAVTATR
jgi:hypothetical protein